MEMDTKEQAYIRNGKIEGRISLLSSCLMPQNAAVLLNGIMSAPPSSALCGQVWYQAIFLLSPNFYTSADFP